MTGDIPLETAPTGGRNRPALLLALVIVATALIVVDMTIVAVGLPQIERDLGGGLAGLQWVIVGYSVMYGALLQTAGSLSDRLGRRGIFIAGIVLFTLASMLCALAWNVLALDVFRILQGIGGAMLFASAMPLIADAYDGQRRAMAIAIWSAAVGSCAALAPLVGGALIEVGGWRWMFIVNVPIGCGALVAAWRLLPSNRPGQLPGRIDWGGAALIGAGLILVNVALTRGEQQGWTSTATLSQSVCGLLLLAAFVWTERRVSAPMLDLSLFRIPSFTGAVILSFLARVATLGVMAYLMIYLQLVLGLSPWETGVALLPLFVVMLPAGILGGKLQARFAPSHIIAVGFAVLVVGGVLLSRTIGPDTDVWSLAGPFALWGFGGGLASAPLMGVAVNVVSPDRAGMASGMTNSFFPIGTATGTAVFGVVFVGQVRSGVESDPSLPAQTRDQLVAAVRAGQLPDGSGVATEPGVTATLREAISTAAATTTLWGSLITVLAIVTALLLIRQRDVVTAEPDAQISERAPAVD